MWYDDNQSRDGNKIIEGYDDNDILYIYIDSIYDTILSIFQYTLDTDMN